MELLQQLTFLPLAIVQAAAYINENGITFSAYLSLLKDQEQDVIDLLSEDFEDDGRYRDTQNTDVKNPVATTWLISFEQIRRLDPKLTPALFITKVRLDIFPQNQPDSSNMNKSHGKIARYNILRFI
jgi:hypothetical protein